MSEFAKNLRKYRKLNHLTQQKLAEKMNYGYTAISNYESGRNEPSLDDLISLSIILNTTPNDLIGFAPEEKEAKYLACFKKLKPIHQKIILDLIDSLQSESLR